MGSNTKTMVATVILRLVAAHRHRDRPAAGQSDARARLRTRRRPAGPAAVTAFVGPRRPDGYVDTTHVNLSAECAAGGMVSTAGDWARFDTGGRERS